MALVQSSQPETLSFLCPSEASPGTGRFHWAFHWAIALHLKAQLVKLVMWLFTGEGGAVTESLGLSVHAPASVQAVPSKNLSSRIILWTQAGILSALPSRRSDSKHLPCPRVERSGWE